MRLRRMLGLQALLELNNRTTIGGGAGKNADLKVSPAIEPRTVGVVTLTYYLATLE